MNLVLEKTCQVPYHTEIGMVLQGMGSEPLAYDWYVSDVETNMLVPCLADGDTWLSGEELAIAIQQPIQFIWAVFSAFPIGARFDVSTSPIADGNSSFWRPPEISPQLPGASFEIVCWDSSATILIGITQDQAGRFLRTFSDAKPLADAWDLA